VAPQGQISESADDVKAIPISLEAGGAIEDDYLTVTMLSAGLAQILRRRARATRGERNEEGVLPPAWRVALAGYGGGAPSKGSRPYQRILRC